MTAGTFTYPISTTSTFIGLATTLLIDTNAYDGDSRWGRGTVSLGAQTESSVNWCMERNGYWGTISPLIVVIGKA